MKPDSPPFMTKTICIQILLASWSEDGQKVKIVQFSNSRGRSQRDKKNKSNVINNINHYFFIVVALCVIELHLFKAFYKQTAAMGSAQRDFCRKKGSSWQHWCVTGATLVNTIVDMVSWASFHTAYHMLIWLLFLCEIRSKRGEARRGKQKMYFCVQSVYSRALPWSFYGFF